MSNNLYINKSSKLSLPIVFNNSYKLNTKPKKIIKENSIQKLNFNIMPCKFIYENSMIKEYRVWDDALEVVFDREYESDMIKSPDHLTFLSSLMNLQKMVYVYMNSYLGLKYSKTGPENLKVWPHKLNIEMPKMILNKKNIVHTMLIESIFKISKNKYKISAKTNVNGITLISGDALIVVL